MGATVGEAFGVHRVFVQDAPLLAPGERVEVVGPEAEHAARVKRLGPGDAVALLDGRGTVAAARVESTGKVGKGGWRLAAVVESVATAERVRPRVEVWSATPKGGRVDELVDGLSQVGAAAWSPLRAERSVVQPRETKLERLERIAWEAAKQCGRAWVLEIGRERSWEEAIAPEVGVRVVLADASGGPYERTGAEGVRVLVGPEGGWTEAELAAARAAGATIARFGPHAMRIETAAVVAVAVVLDVEGREARG